MPTLAISEESTPTIRKSMSNDFSFSSSSKTIAQNYSFPSSANLATPVMPLFGDPKTEDIIQNAQSIITKWDLNSSSYTKISSLFQHSRQEANEFLNSVTDLRHAMLSLVSYRSSSSMLVTAQKLMQIAMKRLEKELYYMLSNNRDHLDPESVSSGHRHDSSSSGSVNTQHEASENEIAEVEVQEAGESITEMENASQRTMLDIKSIVDCMVRAGYGKECIKIYKILRKSIIDEGLYRLGIDGYRSSRIQKMSWSSQEHIIENWLNAVKIAVRTLFRGERILCDYVFSSSDTVRESCFTEIAKEGATNLLKFPELVLKIKGNPDKIFLLIKVYEAMFDLWPEIESIFSFKSTAPVKLQTLSSLVKLGESVQAILSDYETSIQKDSSKILPPGGGIHPLTRSVMTFICSLSEFSSPLSDILIDHSHPGNFQLPEPYFDNPESNDLPTSPVPVRLAWLILVLLCKLDGKAEYYRDVSLSYLFLANNLQFVVEKVNTTNLKYLLGDEWISRNSRKVNQYAMSYEYTSWNKVFLSLPDGANDPGISREDMQDCLIKFNAAFEEVYRKQASWFVPDGILRDEFKMSIARKLVPAYKEFHDKYLVVLSGDRSLVKFGPDDLGNYLSDLFHGTTISGGSSSSSTLSAGRSRGCLPR